MGWLPVVLSGIAALLLYKTGHSILMVLAIMATVGSFSSWGMMHNYATQVAKWRPGYRRRFYDITSEEAEAVPDWMVSICVAFGLLGLGLLIAGIALGLSGPRELGPWLNWIVLLIGLFLLFVIWSWVPLEHLDRYWAKNNEIGRPFINTLVLTGLPALYATLTGTPASWLLIPICFLLTQYAVLAGRFLKREMFIAGWVMILTTAGIWAVYFAL